MTPAQEPGHCGHCKQDCPCAVPGCDENCFYERFSVWLAANYPYLAITFHIDICHHAADIAADVYNPQISDTRTKPEQELPDFANAKVGDWYRGVGFITTIYEQDFVRRFGAALKAQQPAESCNIMTCPNAHDECMEEKPAKDAPRPPCEECIWVGPLGNRKEKDALEDMDARLKKQYNRHPSLTLEEKGENNIIDFARGMIQEIRSGGGKVQR